MGTRYPLELRITETPSVIVNRHNEIFPYLLRYKNAVLLHIDHHHDFSDNVGTFNPDFHSIEDYTKEIGISQFICASVHQGAISVVYHINPRHIDRHIGKGLLKEGKVAVPLTTYTEGKHEIEFIPKLNMKFRKSEEICFFNEYSRKDGMTIQDICSEVQNYSDALILDVELDAFYSEDDARWEFGPGLDNNEMIEKSRCLIEQRVNYFESFVSECPKPSFIAITRAQGLKSKDEFVPSELADELQQKVLNILTNTL